MTDADEEFEDRLAEMLDFLAGKGKYRGLGKGRITEGVAEDMEDHAALCELRRRGQARRTRDGDGWAWEATGFRRAE